MKALTTNRLIEICAAAEADLHNAALILGRTFKGESFEWVTEGVKRGHYAANTIKLDGVASYVTVHHVTLQNRLCVNAAVQLLPNVADLNALVAALIQMARDLGCKGIEFLTVRAGLVKRVMELGFKPAGVAMELDLT